MVKKLDLAGRTCKSITSLKGAKKGGKLSSLVTVPTTTCALMSVPSGSPLHSLSVAQVGVGQSLAVSDNAVQQSAAPPWTSWTLFPL